MMAMGIMHPHYWVKHDVDVSFRRHLATWKEHFAMPKTLGSSEK
jgi:hypothetical protein